MNAFLEKNVEVVKEKHEEIEINEELVKKINRAEEIEEIIAYNGYMLRSNVDQEKAINVWCEQFRNLKFNEVALIFGIGSLDYYVQLRKEYPTLKIIVYEPCEEIFYNCMAKNDYTGLLSEDDICICVGKKKHNAFGLAMNNMLGYESDMKAYYAIIPNYHKAFEEEYELYKQALTEAIEGNRFSRNTNIHFDKMMIDNYLNNLTKIPGEATVLELFKTFNKSNIKKYPAIILSGGPSLDKNINKIAKIKGRAFIIAVNTAVNTAIKNNVRPDIVITVDPVVEADSFRDERGRDIPLVISMHGSPLIRDVNSGRKFYISARDKYLNDVLRIFNKSIINLSTGGSVANSAFSFAQCLDIDIIILMGQDLGFPGNKKYAEDAFIDEEDAAEDGINFYVDGIDGGQVLTSPPLDIYRKWFEDQIRMYPDLTVIDATEGGALIHGSEIMTIDSAIEKYCPEEVMDFESLINDADYLVDGNNKGKLKEIINKTFEDIDYNIEYLKNAKRDYYKLRDVNEKRDYNSLEFKQIIDKVSEHNKYVEGNKDFGIYKMCCTEEYYKCIDALKTVYDDEYVDIKNLVDQSLIMLDEYIHSGEILKKKWNELTNGKGIV